MNISSAGLDFRVEQLIPRSGNLEPLLHQIRHALDDLLERERESSIDLRGLPLGPGEERELLEFLGQGEVEATLESQGPSLFRESRFPGVWLSIHKNQAGEVLGKFIEICRIPYILKAQTADVREGMRQLQQDLTDRQEE